MSDPHVTLKDKPKKWKAWLKGLIAAAIGSFVTTALASVSDPHILYEAIYTGDWALFKIAGGSAVLNAFLYLKRSPIWDD